MAEELPEDLRRRADDVLAQDKFKPDEPGLLDRAWDRVTELINDLLGVITDNTIFGGVALGWVLLGLMIALIVFFLVRYTPRFGSARTSPAEATITTHKNRLSRVEWLARAEEADRTGLYREAVRARYRATVAGLIEARELPDSQGATPAELRDSFDAEPARHEPFASSTAAFSDVWYGGAAADRTRSEQLAQWDGQVSSKDSR
jgi:hypothetical protein